MATEVVMPALGLTVEKGVIIEWYKKEGDPVQKGEYIFLIEADKVTTDVESPATGILAKILVPPDNEVPILTVVGVITSPGEKLPSKYTSIPVETSVAESETFGTGTTGDSSPRIGTSISTVRAVPAARKMALNKGLDLKSMTGSGPDGVILVKDVESVVAKTAKPPVKISTLARGLAERKSVPLEKVQGTGVRGRVMRTDVVDYLDKVNSNKIGFGAVIPITSMRKTISRRMAESAFTAPHIYFFSEIWFDPLLGFRQKVLPDFEKNFGIRVSINDFLIKAVALNILDFPLLNAQIKEDTIHVMPDVNVGLAVAVAEGLIVPAIANADRSGLVEITRQRFELVARARKGTLKLEEMERGTFTISSLAHYDITHFTAILNPPQSGILSVGRIDEKLVMVNGQVEVHQVAKIGIAVDHRIIDGAVAADFLQNLKWKLERPSFTFCNL